MAGKIAVFGFGKIERIIYSSTDCFYTTERNCVKNESFLTSLTSVINRYDSKLLVNEYRKVQKKYYPEKDLLIKNYKEIK